MALILAFGKDNIEVISSKDGSLGISPNDLYRDEAGNVVKDEQGKEVTVYQRYLETLDESLLCLKPESVPTRFVMRRILPYEAAHKIKSAQAGMNDEGKMEVRMGYIMEEVRASLVDVRDPGTDALAFKRDSDGRASKELISLLESVGIVNELYAARQGLIKGGVDSKKS